MISTFDDFSVKIFLAISTFDDFSVIRHLMISTFDDVFGGAVTGRKNNIKNEKTLLCSNLRI